MLIEPYLFFEGRCDDAVEFYRQTLGAEVGALMRYKESPEPHQPGALPPGSENKVMHGILKIGDTTAMVSDGRCSGIPDFRGFALTINAPDVTRADQMFAALADGGQVQMAQAKTFFSPRFGMVTDRFGVLWMIIVMP